MRLTPANLFWLIAYLATMALLVAGMMRMREWSADRFDTPQARAQWEAWREAAGDPTLESRPVERRVPQSAEPPTLVLLRDHFAACLITVLILSSALFLTLMVLVRGALFSRPP